MDGGAWWAAVHGVAKSQTRLSDFPFTFHFHALEKEMATHSSVLAWRLPGMGEPGGLPSMGSHRVGHDWSDLAAAAAAAEVLMETDKRNSEPSDCPARDSGGLRLGLGSSQHSLQCPYLCLPAGWPHRAPEGESQNDKLNSFHFSHHPLSLTSLFVPSSRDIEQASVVTVAWTGLQFMELEDKGHH